MTESWPATVIHRLDAMVHKYPNRIALKEPSGIQLTYLQLQQRISIIIKQMLHYGVNLGARIAVFLSPSADWVCSLFAIMRIGGIYVPLDRKLGLDRLASIVSDSKPMAILIDSSTVSDLPGLNSEAQCIDISHTQVAPGEYLPNLALPEQTAIIMYTSGSTGVPKGISLCHSAYIQHIQAFCAEWDVQEATETILHQSSYAWDMSIYQILICACSGGTLIIADSFARGDPVAIAHLISANRVTTSFATPTEYFTWLRHGKYGLQGSCLKMAVCGGEFISASLIREFQSLNKSGLRLVNVYGPTETTLACSSAEVLYMQTDLASAHHITGLRPLPNYSIYIADQNLNPVPIGVPGEVVVGGAGIAQGYLDGNQTKERFFPDNHASSFFKRNNWVVVHRTGDRGKLTKANGLVLLGRIFGDNQIKLGGIRMNVEEIERAILHLSDGAISQAVVSPRYSEPQFGHQKLILVAFVVMDKFTGDSARFLQDLLRDIPVPSFMRPIAMVPVESLPLNASYKVDRLAINKLLIPHVVSNLKPMTSDVPVPLENLLHQLWKEVIPHEAFSLYTIRSESDFFHVGGSSLSLVGLQSLIKQQLGFSVPLYQLFESSTLREMAKRLQSLSSEFAGVIIDWEAEVQGLVTGVSAQRSIEIDRHNSPIGTNIVVLTGATGFIGRELLKQLVNDDQIQSVYCIAVRKSKEMLPPILHHSKVHIWHGDLGAPRLGLSVADATTIFNCADIVIHNGADVSFMKTYQSLKLINVASTEELIKLVLPRRIPFHFVSSASVTRLAKQMTFGEVSVALYPPSNIQDDGYTAMKWVSEVFLERISRDFGLGVWVHRPSSVTGVGAPTLDLMRNVIEYCQKTRMIPDLSSWSGVFDLVSVESVSSQIMEVVRISATSNASGKVRYIHECGETRLSPDEVKPFLESSTGEHFKVLPLGDWVHYAETTGMSPLIGLYLRKSSEGLALLPILKRENITRQEIE